MKSVKGQRALRVVASAWCVVAAASAEAETTAEFTVGATHTDNVGRTKVDEQTETVGTAGLSMGIDLERPRLTTDIGANLEYRDYIDQSYDSEVVGGLAGTLSYAFVIERFLWTFEDNYGQIANDRTQADTPDNRQNFNYFSTGPDIIVPFGTLNSAQLSGRWSDTYYEESEQQGSESFSGSLALVRELSEASAVSLNGSTARTTYDENIEDSEIVEGFLRYDFTGSRTTFSGDFGYTEARSGDQPADDGFLFRLTASRQVGARSSVSFRAGSEFSDTGTAVRLSQDALGVQPESTDAIATSDVFRNNYVYLTFSSELSRTTFSVGVYGNQERYREQITLDRDVIGASFTVDRRMTPRLGLSVTADYSDEEFKAGAVAFDEWSVDLSLSWQLTRDWSLVAGAAHFGGSGDGTARDYDENRASLDLRYSIGR